MRPPTFGLQMSACEEGLQTTLRMIGLTQSTVMEVVVHDDGGGGGVQC